MADSASTIPTCAVELLFVGDLMDRILYRHTGRQFRDWRATPYKDFVFNAFSDEIAEAVDFIDAMLEWEIDETFSRMVDNHQVNREAFVDYARHFEELCFKQGFDADNFLHFCVRVVSLASYYAQYGEPIALELALFFVTKVMTNYDLFEGGWDTLKAVAKKYVERKEDFCKVLTPDISEDESLMNEALEDDEDGSYDLEQDSSFGIDQDEKSKDELDINRFDSSGLDSTSSYDAERYIANEDHEFAIIREENSKYVPDSKQMDLSDPKLDLPAIYTIKTEGNISNVNDGSTITVEEKSQDKPDHEWMDLSGPKPDFKATFESETEESMSNGYDEYTIAQKKGTLYNRDNQIEELSDLEFSFPAGFESKVKLRTSSVDSKCSIINLKKQEEHVDEKINFSGSKLEQPTCSET